MCLSYLNNFYEYITSFLSRNICPIKRSTTTQVSYVNYRDADYDRVFDFKTLIIKENIKKESDKVIELLSDGILNLVSKSESDESIFKELFENLKSEDSDNELNLFPNSYSFEHKKKMLSLYCINNPFFTSMLIEIDNGFVLDFENKHDCYSYFTRLMVYYDTSYKKTNIYFDKSLNIISEIDEVTFDKMLFLLTFYLQVIHASIHLFNSLMIHTLYTQLDKDSNTYEFIRKFCPNVYLKQLEVETLLISNKGIFFGGIYSSDRELVLNLMGELLVFWTSNLTSIEILNKFIFANITNQYIFLSEFKKQIKLIQPYTNEIVQQLDIIEFEDFFENTNLSIDNMNQWLELMSFFGMLHGASISFTKLIISPCIMKSYSSNSNVTYKDIFDFTVGILTITGQTSKMAVFNTGLEYHSNDRINTIQAKYYGESIKMKHEYENRIKQYIYFKEFFYIFVYNMDDTKNGGTFTMSTYI